VAGVLLAAGASSRMGAQKLLLPIGGRPLVQHVATRLRSAAIDELVVVLGRDAELVRSALCAVDCRFVENPRYRDGLGTSFRCAVETLGANARGALFMLADRPFVTTGMLDTLLATYRRTRPLVVISRFGGVIAPPHVFDRRVFARLGGADGGTAKDLLRTEPERCAVVDLPEVGLVDVDDAADYARALDIAAREAQAAPQDSGVADGKEHRP
jgi:molybdenum cofactor cytidylyltransferase